MPDREPDQNLIRAIGETPTEGWQTGWLLTRAFAGITKSPGDASYGLISAIASRVERYYAERPVSDAEYTAAESVFFKSQRKDWDIGLIRAALEAARKVRGGE